MLAGSSPSLDHDRGWPVFPAWVVVLLGLEDFVGAAIDWETPMEGAASTDSKWFPPANQDFEPPRAASPEEFRPLRDWLMPAADSPDLGDARWIDNSTAQDIIDEAEDSLDVWVPEIRLVVPA